jgi:hypothetical protein
MASIFEEDPCNLLTFEQNILATLGQLAIWIPLIYYFERKKKPTKIHKKEKGPYRLTAVDHFFGGLLVFFMVLNTLTRIGRGVPHWLVQVSIYLIALSEKNSLAM